MQSVMKYFSFFLPFKYAQFKTDLLNTLHVCEDKYVRERQGYPFTRILFSFT